MPALRDYHIIISHSWDYNNDYLGFTEKRERSG